MPRKGSTQKVRKALDLKSLNRRLPTQSEFVEELVRLAGGPKQLAQVIWDEMQKPKTPPLLRARVIELILRALKAIDDEAKPPAPEDMTDEELEAVINDIVERRGAGADGDA